MRRIAPALLLLLAGCGLFDQWALRPKNQLPPPPPVTYSTFRQPGWDWTKVARVVVFTPHNESEYTRTDSEFHTALTAELQRLGRFEVVAAPPDEQAALSQVAHRGGSFDQRLLLDIAKRTRADVVVLVSVTQYSPYPRPRMAVVIQAVAPAEGKVIASVDGLWDTADGGIAEQVRAYYRQREKPLPAYVRNYVIAADDNFAADVALDSPALFQRWVANVTSRLLVDGPKEKGEQVPRSIAGRWGQGAEECDQTCPPAR